MSACDYSLIILVIQVFPYEGNTTYEVFPFQMTSHTQYRVFFYSIPDATNQEQGDPDCLLSSPTSDGSFRISTK